MKRYFQSVINKRNLEIDALKKMNEEQNDQLKDLTCRLKHSEEVNDVLVDENNARIVADAKTTQELETKLLQFRKQQKINMCCIGLILTITSLIFIFG